MSARRSARGPEFVEQTLAGAVAVVSGSTFERCRFEKCMLQSADLSRCRFVECRFEGANLAAARVTDCELRDVAFVGSKLTGIDWTAATRFLRVSFDDCVLDQSAFLGMKLRGAAMSRCRLRGVVFAEADLTEADLRGSDLTGAQFGRTKLARADLRGATGYAIHPGENDVKGLRVGWPEGLSLLDALGVDLEV